MDTPLMPRIVRFCFSLWLFAGLNAYAATTWVGTTNSDFGTASNWDNDAPGEVDDGLSPPNVATIDNGDTVNLNSPYSSTYDFRLTVSGNSTLNVSSSVTAGFLNIDAGSTVNILNGGNFVMPKVSDQNNVGYTIHGTLEIRSGATAVFNERLWGAGTIRVIGDGSTINFHQIVSGRNFEFVFDDTGVSGLVGAGTSGAGPYWNSLGSSTLHVDGSAFNGSGTFTLFETTDNAYSVFDTNSVTITGLGDENVGWTLQQYQSGGKNYVELTVIPEPGTYALCGGLLVLTAVVVRRRGASIRARILHQSY